MFMFGRKNKKFIDGRNFAYSLRNGQTFQYKNAKKEIITAIKTNVFEKYVEAVVNGKKHFIHFESIIT